MKSSKYPTWWDCSIDFAWDHIKLAMRRDWNRRQNDLLLAPLANAGTPGSNRVLFDDLETAFRFGYGARWEYDTAWNDNLEIALAKEWRAMNPSRMETWEHDREAILYGWEFEQATDDSHVAPAIDWQAPKTSVVFDRQLSRRDMVAA
jgi:hypothetical protein